MLQMALQRGKFIHIQASFLNIRTILLHKHYCGYIFVFNDLI